MIKAIIFDLLKEYRDVIRDFKDFWKKEKYEKVSPLQDELISSLRYSGESVAFKRQKAIDSYLSRMYISAALIGIVVLSWINYFDNTKVSLIAISIFVFVIVAFSIPAALTALRRARKLQEAQNGERIVAEYLNQLIAENYKVFHDVPCYNKEKIIFNIDHLLVGKQGIFAVETKTMRKIKGNEDEKLRFDGKYILRFIWD